MILLVPLDTGAYGVYSSSMSKVRNVSDVLREAIHGDGRSLRQLGEACGVSWAVLSRFARGERDITLGTADRVCQALGLKLTGRRSDRKDG